jgi:hypothetical protein
MKGWPSVAEIMRSWGYRQGISPDKVAILNAVWERELGHMARHWKLKGIRRGMLYIAPKSSGAALELQMRSQEIVRGLNKYFRTAWIKGVRVAIN